MPIKIFVDQGHNPVNPNAGAEGNGLREQDLTYRIGVDLAALLNGTPGYEARLSRNSPDEVLGQTNLTSLAARTTAANQWGADYFLSLHANASYLAAATGSEAYVFARDSAAYFLARDILIGLNNATGLPDRGVFLRPSLYVLRKTAMPAVLLEMGFISNAGDAALMAGQPGRFAQGIYQGILAYTA